MPVDVRTFTLAPGQSFHYLPGPEERFGFAVYPSAGGGFDVCVVTRQATPPPSPPAPRRRARLARHFTGFTE